MKNKSVSYASVEDNDGREMVVKIEEEIGGSVPADAFVVIIKNKLLNAIGPVGIAKTKEKAIDVAARHIYLADEIVIYGYTSES